MGVWAAQAASEVSEKGSGSQQRATYARGVAAGHLRVTSVRGQSRSESLVESALNIGSGFLLSWLMWVWVAAPLFAIEVRANESLAIVCLFTITSLIRSYLWRRAFNWIDTR